MGHMGGNLPPILSKEEEEKYVIAWENGDINARNELIEHNLRLVAHIAKKYNFGGDNEELISIGTVGLIKAVETYKADKGRLATYASKCIENEIRMHLRQNKKRQNDISLQDSVGVDKEGNEVSLEDKLAYEGKSVEEVTTLKIRIEKLYKAMAERLTPREHKILILRYGLNGEREKTQREIAADMGISRSYVSRIETKALSKLRDI